MIIDDLDFERVARIKAEADAKLVVDPNAMLPHTISLESLQLIVRRDTQIVQTACPMKHGQFAHGDGFDVRKPSNARAGKQSLSIGASE
jgi:hypothetical protein